MKASVNRRKWIDITCFLAVVTLMVGLSVVMREKEIIFPEVGAIAAGMFLTPNRPWMTNGRRMILCLILCAALGMVMVRFVSLPLVVQMILAYALAYLIQSLSATSFMPMISAMVLPVLLRSRSPWYLVSVAIFSLLIVFIRKILEKAGERQPEDFIPIDKNIPLSLALFRLVTVSVMITIAMKSGLTFLAAPPLLVAFTELSAYKNKAIRLHPVRIILLMTLSAAAGAYVRLAFTVLPESYMPLSLLVSSIIFLVAFYHIGPMVPPAGALMILAYLADTAALPTYPLQVLIGMSAYVTVTLLRNTFTKRHDHLIS